MAEEKNKTIKRAKIEMNYLTGDEEVQRLAELRERWEMDRASERKYAMEEGLKQGKKLGKADLVKISVYFFKKYF